ncbi:MAG: Asp-tRNA(Asn)/Glu-tRNA(Gln) amidotransferase subunit GatB [Bacteroidetes bacterium SB0662_bin_6]|nr:Asp-tRNA(Asn)/Glu-tRNA(Gln) amidotransferase subunit GatB [Bacteroidetes bacterium SB0668_bin_1]MYE05086.1 Asp-tRNA(Asn)/Glu-tRNA(Gln) amidotransferase subunit GatB [Bacteroidetes bacterium SB0662_bin_6]
MPHATYEPVIGLEVHCRLLTDSKAFSSDSARFGAGPNVHVDPVSLGHPGTLPVLNRRMVDYTLRMGLATHCRIAPRSVLARKHYFYPDLPKGYQISQYETPICAGGHVDIVLQEKDAPPVIRRIGLTRIHMEEDAGRSIHDQDPYDTLLDYNRCGTPLIEIVSEPDLRSPREAYLYMRKIRQIVRYLGISDGNMEEGSLRCDANVSIRPLGSKDLCERTEIKNMNSFRNVERALDYEIGRQIRLVQGGGKVVRQTLLWDADRQETRPMRSKEEAHDYRYFPDPDLAPVFVTDEELDRIRGELPEMPEARSTRFQDAWGLPAYDAAILTEERELADYFEETLTALGVEGNGKETHGPAKSVSNMIMGDVLRVLKENATSIEELPIRPPRLAALVRLRLGDRISSTAAQEIFEAMLERDDAPEAIAEEQDLIQVSDVTSLAPVVENVLDDHPQQVAAYLGGKEGLIGYFIGQAMRRFEGSPDPKLVRKLLLEGLEARRE